MKAALAVSALVALAAAAPHAKEFVPTKTSPLEKRATTVCGQWDTVETGSYIVYNDLWGEDSGTGSQCLTVNGITNGLLQWSTAYSWSGGPYNVKSFSNAVLQAPTARISAISSIPTKWQWSYTGTGLVADVAYDLFSSTDCSSSASYEIMVWIGALGGAGPLSSSGSPVATTTIGGTSWSLYSGVNGAMTVFSFVAASNVTDYSGDLNDFLQYLVKSQGYPSSQCLYAIGAGTEPFLGTDAEFTVAGYSATVSASAAATSSSSPGDGGGGSCAALYGQCGGTGWSGPTCCSSGTCTYGNAYYSQCL